MELQRSQIEIQRKLQQQMEKNRLDAMIITTPEAIFYCTGFASQFLYISNRIGMAMAVVPKHGEVTLLVSGFEKLAADQAVKDVRVESYPVWIYIKDLDDGKEKDAQPDMNMTFRMAIEAVGTLPENARIGIQTESMPFQKWEYLCNSFGKDSLVDCEPTLRETRVRKTAWEIAVLRENTRYLEQGMFNTYKKICPGMSEQEVCSLWNKECFSLSDDIYNVFHTHVMGENWSPRLIPDASKIVRQGDVIRMDGAVWRKGYGSDLGRAAAIGGKAAKEGMARIYEALYAGYSRLIEMAGPGVRLCDVFHEVVKAVQHYIPEYRRGHVGHSIGCNRFSEESPFIAPTEKSVFEPGMIFCTEVPYYSTEFNSYNLEDTLLITENGVAMFSHISPSLNWTGLRNTR